MTHWFYRSVFVCLLAGVSLFGCARVSSPGGRLAGRAPKAGAGPAPVSEKNSERQIRSSAHFAAGVSYDLNQQPEKALEEYWLAAEANPEYEPVVLEVARRMLRAKKPEKAIEILNRAKSVPGASGTVYAWLGLAYAQLGQTESAVEANRTAIKKAPRALAAYQNLAQLYLQTSQTNQALEVIAEAASQKGVEPEFLVDLAEVLLRFGHLQLVPPKTAKEQAAGLLDRAARLDPEDPEVTEKLANGYLMAGESAKAEAFYVRMLAADPELLSVRANLAQIYLNTGRKEKATEQLLAIARENPTNFQTYLLLGGLAMDEKNYDRAAEYLERVLLLRPDLEQAYYDLGGLKISLKKPQEALAILDKARARFKLNFALEFYTAIAQGMLKKYDQAVQFYTSAELIGKTSETNRLNQHFYFQFGAACERHGDFEQAERQFEQALALAPDFAEALNYLGYMWAERGVKLERARELIEKAVALEPENAAFLDSLGWVLFKLNQPEKALEHLLEAIRHAPEPDPTLFDHLGDIHAALKQYEKARAAWSKSLTIEANEQTEQIKKKIESLPGTDRSAP